MPVERSVLFAALWIMEQGRWRLKQPVQQQIYGFMGFKLHLWSHFMDIFQWCYCKGVATAALEELQAGQSKSAQSCTGIFPPVTRAEPQAEVAATLCKQHCPLLGAVQPSPGAPQPLPPSKACQTPPEQAGLLWDAGHLYAAAERMTEAQQTRAANSMLMLWPIA